MFLGDRSKCKERDKVLHKGGKKALVREQKGPSTHAVQDMLEDHMRAGKYVLRTTTHGVRASNVNELVLHHKSKEMALHYNVNIVAFDVELVKPERWGLT